MPAPDHRVGYVLKMYPRFSETFILHEILALEALGTPIEIFSLRPPADGRFHEELAAVRAPVHYLPHRVKAGQLWEVLRRCRPLLPGLPAHLDELLAAEPDEAAAAVELAAVARGHGLTHLHAHFGSVATGVARLAASLAGLRYTFTAHAKDIFHDDVDPAVLRQRVADAAAVVTVSDYNLAHLRSRYAGSHPERVVRIYNGLDLGRFGYHPPGERSRRPGAPDAPSVCAVGRLVEKKGFDDLLRAVAVLRRDRPALRLDLVGTGPEETALRRLAGELGLDAAVCFHGPLPQSRVRDVVRRAAVFAAPCVVGADGNRDGLPTVLLEALASGTPCVATPVTGIPEAIRHRRTGLLVPESDPAALATAIGRLLDAGDLAADLAAAGRRLVETEFDVRRSAARLDRLFRSVALPRAEEVPA